MRRWALRPRVLIVSTRRTRGPLLFSMSSSFSGPSLAMWELSQLVFLALNSDYISISLLLLSLLELYLELYALHILP